MFRKSETNSLKKKDKTNKKKGKKRIRKKSKEIDRINIDRSELNNYISNYNTLQNFNNQELNLNTIDKLGLNNYLTRLMNSSIENESEGQLTDRTDYKNFSNKLLRVTVKFSKA